MAMLTAIAVASSVAAFAATAGTGGSTRSFEISNDAFVKDGNPLVLRSGSLHYFRVPPTYWQDRIRRLKALGLNSVTTYVPWNFHETEEGRFNFGGWANVTAFVEAVHSEGLLMILRPGPYICAEWEMGGLPAWLLAKPGIKLRTYEQQYIAAVERWWGELLPRVRPYLYSLGGPIAMVQLENEYGSFGNCAANPDDAKYMRHLLDVASAHFGAPVVYSTIDGGEGERAAQLEAGSPFKGDDRVFATVDGSLAASYAESFERQRAFNAPGKSPKMWCELWVGWMTSWGVNAANKSGAEFHSGVAEMVQEAASFSLYMAHGGTNFGFWSGANSDSSGLDFLPDITSYDYSAPIGEAGDHNVGLDGGDLFEAVRGALAATFGEPADEPAPIPKSAYGRVELREVAPLFENLGALATCAAEIEEGAELPSLEAMGHFYGLTLYRRLGRPAAAAARLAFSNRTLRDRVQVFVDGAEVGVAYRPRCPQSVALPEGGGSLDLLVENMGRVNYGPGLHDPKGLLGAPPAPGTWLVRCLPLQTPQLRSLRFGPANSTRASPAFWRGALQIDGTPQDTFLAPQGLRKGYIWVNGHALGRYWMDEGPQLTLYLPAPFLQTGSNEVLILELHAIGTTAGLASVATPLWSPPKVRAEPTAAQAPITI